VKDIAYFQNKTKNHPEAIDNEAGIVIQPKDMISIVVSSRNPELVTMFNLPVVSYQAGSEIVSGAGQQRLLGYVVDEEGNIDFPVLGPIKVAGLTRWELSGLIKNRLIKEKYLSDAVVTVEFMNLKVAVIGEVNSPGLYSIEGDKVTVLQALALARDLTIFGRRDNVSVIREQDGKRVIYEINLTDVDLFKSPAYYLQQNDVVYVQPNDIKARQSTTDDKTLRISSIALSSGSLLVSMVTLLATLGVFSAN
jgi:polysaccharide export outer membrane protein